MSTMINWCLRYGKNLVSKHDAIDLTTTTGKIMVTIIGGIAEIEAANTSTRVTSLWDYTKTQSAWLVGMPAFGYETADDEAGRIVLVIDKDAYRGTALVPQRRDETEARIRPSNGQGSRPSRPLRTRSDHLHPSPPTPEPSAHGLPRGGGQERGRAPVEDRAG
ncbi:MULTISPECIES: recombinase family protein [unclassified Streptomyces]|uniref:recombinase family protein n=1 Tax=unclassified Streptomyces TaxID=2593676 RepID=UPI002474FD1B|nr:MULTISPECIES: recombinase family protein [unclassified Streptomyces]